MMISPGKNFVRGYSIIKELNFLVNLFIFFFLFLNSFCMETDLTEQ